MTASRIWLTAVSTVLVASTLTATAAAPARADDYCDYEDSTFPVVSGFSPASVVVGLTPVLVTFRVSAHDECGIDGWTVSGRDFFAYDKNPSETIYGWSNADAGTTYADVEVNDPAFNTTTKRFGFRLLRRATFSALADATPEPVRRNTTLTVRGKLTRADWDSGKYASYGGQRVQVQFAARGSSTWTTVATTTSDHSGQVSARIKVGGRTARDGSYRLFYSGNSVTGPAVSRSDFVDYR